MKLAKGVYSDGSNLIIKNEGNVTQQYKLCATIYSATKYDDGTIQVISIGNNGTVYCSYYHEDPSIMVYGEPVLEIMQKEKLDDELSIWYSSVLDKKFIYNIKTNILTPKTNDF